MNRFNAAAVGLIAFSALPGLIFGFMTVIENGFSFIAPLGFSLVLFPFTLAATLIFGAPLFYIAYRFDFVRWWTSMLGGAIAGAMASWVVFNSVQLKGVGVNYPLPLDGEGGGFIFGVRRILKVNPPLFYG